MTDIIKRLRASAQILHMGLDADMQLEVAAELMEAADQLEEYKSQLRDIRNAALPDPYDERDISVEWLRAVINRSTPPE